MATKKTTTKTVSTKETTKVSYADRLRKKLIEDAGKALNSSNNNSVEFSPDFGTYRIRVLPPVTTNEKNQLVEDPDGKFYHTHSYHWMPSDPDDLRGKSGKFMWTHKYYTVNGKKKPDPIDEAVKQFYSIGRKENNQELLDMGGILKRKRNFFCNIILYTEEGPEFRVLVDKTNEGKLIRLMCAAMGMPFWRDVEDNWVEKDSAEIDEDREYVDLIDPEFGYDFKIVKKKTGNKAWDISYEGSYAMKTPRALTDEEREIMNQRVDLKTYKEYEEDYAAVKSALENLIGKDDEDEDDDVEEITPVKKAPVVKKELKTKPMVEEEIDEDEEVDEELDEEDEEVNLDDDESIDELVDQLDDEDEEE